MDYQRLKLAPILFVVAFLVAALAFTGAPVRAQAVAAQPPPEVEARAWALADVRSGELLASEDVGRELPMGSIDKIMVALVVLDAVASGEASLDDDVTVSEEAASFAVPLYSNVGLFPGDEVSVRELLMAALISSGNDAAWALAEHFGGEADETGQASVERFVERMNRTARDLGLEDTRFRNPTGLDDPEQYSSARDLAVIAQAAFDHPLFREAVSTAQTAIVTQDRQIPLASTNDLLFTYGPATGVKTGTTPAAGPSLVASAAAGDESYIVVVLNDEERFADAIELLEYGFKTYGRRELVVEGEEYARAGVPYRRGEEVKLVAVRSVERLVNRSPEVEREVRVVDDMPGSARPGTRLGELVVRVDGERVGSSPLVARRGYQKASLREKIWYTVEGIFE